MRIFFLSVAVSLVLCAMVAPASAQPPRAERPYRGLFGSGTVETGQEITARGSISSGYDDDLEADATGSQVGGSPEARSGVLTAAEAQLAYTLSSSAFTFGVTGATMVRYYPSLEDDNEFVRGSQGRVTAGGKIRTNTSYTLAAAVSYQPYSLGTLFPTVFDPNLGESTLPDLDVAITPGQYLSYDTDATISHRLSKRASLAGVLGYRISEFSQQPGNFSYQTAGGLFRYTVGRGVDVRAGYTYAQAKLSDSSDVPNHGIDAGIDYNKALSFSRRTRLSFSTGTAATRYLDSLRFRVTGDARLEHESGRTWNTSIGYSRQVELNETWTQPVLYDGVTAGVTGLLTRRLQFSATVNAAIGKVGFDENAGSFDSYYGSTQLGYAFSRFMMLSIQYGYYHHRFENSVVLPVNALRQLDRQSIRVGVQLWAPLLQRARRSNATR